MKEPRQEMDNACRFQCIGEPVLAFLGPEAVALEHPMINVPEFFCFVYD